METRKIVKSGNTSYILALPITWIRKNNLENGKIVQVSENDQGDLVITSEKKRTSSKSDIVTIKVDGKNNQTLYLGFLSAYLRDARSIIFEGKEIPHKTTKILEYLSLFIGLDIIEQSQQNIIIKNFFALDAETSPPLLLRKMDIINRAIFEQLKHCASRTFAQEDFSKIKKLYTQNQRLFLLIRKSTLKIFEHPQLMHTIRTTPLQNAKEKIYAQTLIDITSTQLSLGRTFLFLDFTNKDTKHFLTLFNDLYALYLTLLNAWYNKNNEELIEQLQKYATHTESLEKYLNRTQDPLIIQATQHLHNLYHQFEIIAQEALL